MNSGEERQAILNALPRGLYAENLLDIARRANALARNEQHNVATWALIHFGFVALAECWNDPVDVETANSVQKRVVSACETAILDPTPYATENLARELIHALSRLS